MFDEMASGMNRNGYPRSGPAAPILAWPMFLLPLPQKRNLSQSHAHVYWQRSGFRLRKKSLSPGRERENAENSTAPSAALQNRRPSASPAPK
jgi:hypothetical protein